MALSIAYTDMPLIWDMRMIKFMNLFKRVVANR